MSDCGWRWVLTEIAVVSSGRANRLAQLRAMPAEPKNGTLMDLLAGDSGAGACCVVGSGPAGVACAKALLERGRRVHLLDGGITLESGRAALVERLKASKPENWTQADLTAYQAGMNPNVGGVPLKLAYGSDFPYRAADEHMGVHYFGVGLRPSLAQGGLSTAWGAAMLPYAETDVQDWPLSLSTLAQHYAAVLRFTGLAARQDDLAKFFPLYSSELTELRPSAQAAQLLETMARHRDHLARAGIWFGRSRLAVRGNGRIESAGCIYCRLCMYGCPYGHIYSSADTLNELRRHPGFTYQPGVVVRSIRELPGKVEISGYDLETRKPLLWHSRRAFLAAGTIATTGILLRSLEAYDQTAWLQDSQYFLIPFVLLRKVRGATREPLHALSQVFLEILDPSGHGTTAHVQIYSNSDLIDQAVTAVFGPLQRPFGFLLRDLQERLLVAQGFIHSQYRLADCCLPQERHRHQQRSFGTVVRVESGRPERRSNAWFSNSASKPGAPAWCRCCQC